MPFETPLPQGSPLLNGQITATVHEHGTDQPPTTIIQTDDSWAVNVRWSLGGLLENMIAGFWHLHVMLESIGPGPDLDLIDPADHVIPLNPAGTGDYFAHFDIPAGTVPAPAAGRAYKLVVSLTYRLPGAGGGVGPPGPMAAFVEGPILQFYNP